MARSSRTEKLGRELAGLEQEYRDALVVALRDCAEGRWGLFGQNVSVAYPQAIASRMTPASVKQLTEVDVELTRLRVSMGYVGPSDLQARLNEYRRQRGANAAGESRLAESFLAELEF